MNAPSEFPKILKFIVAACAVLSASIYSSIAKADFGEADISKSSSFGAYCGKKGNNCTLIFEPDAIAVNSKSRVAYKQILGYSNLSEYDGGCLMTTQCPLARYIFSIDIDYIKADGLKSTARILFVNSKSYKDFLSSLRSFTGLSSSGEIDPRCPSGGKLIEGSCLTSEQAAQKRYNDAMLWLKASEGISRQQELEIEREKIQSDKYRLQTQPANTPVIIINK